MTEKILSKDGEKVIHLSELMLIFNELGLERFPKKNLHSRNWSDFACQYSPQVQDSIISLSSKSLVICLNNDQICKIRFDNNIETEIDNSDKIHSKTSLFPKTHGIVEFTNGWKGIIMERIKILNKYNYSSGELNRIYYNFFDEISKMHEIGILHNDLGKAINSNIRPNIILSDNRIRLIDFEKVAFRDNDSNWDELLQIEKYNIDEFFYELIDFKCETLT